MSNLPVYALGREEKVFVVPEATYGVAASAPAGGNAVKFLTLSLTQKESRIQRADKRNTRSYLQTIVQRIDTQWSLNGYLLPSGAAGTAPDGWDDIFTAAFGTQTVNASTSVVYTLAKEYQSTLTLHRAVGQTSARGVFSEMARGVVVDKLSFDLSGTTEAMVTASGFAADVLRAGESLCTSTGTLTTAGVTVGDGKKFDAGVYVNIDTDADLLVSAVSGDNLTIPSTTIASGDVVSPSACVKAQTFVSTAIPISGILGSCSYAGSSLEIISAKINMDNLAKVHNDKYGSNKATGYHLGNRLITGQITLRLTADNFLSVAKARSSSGSAPAGIDISIVAGTVAGSIATFDMPNCIVDYTAIPSVASDEIIVTLSWTAYGSSGEDEISLTLT